MVKFWQRSTETSWGLSHSLLWVMMGKGWFQRTYRNSCSDRVGMVWAVGVLWAAGAALLLQNQRNLGSEHGAAPSAGRKSKAALSWPLLFRSNCFGFDPHRPLSSQLETHGVASGEALGRETDPCFTFWQELSVYGPARAGSKAGLPGLQRIAFC